MFGPGKGESIAVHIGDGIWLLVDSCKAPRATEPAAVDYLQSLGADPSTCVPLLVATHWHDDHVRGLARTLNACKSASFVVSAAMNVKEFAKMISARRKVRSTRSTTGVDEMHSVYVNLAATQKQAVFALANRQVFQSGPLTHGHTCTVHTLAPSDAEFQRFLVGLASLMPKVDDTEDRCPLRNPNHLAIVTWIKIGPVDILLGADLQDSTDVNLGWRAIVASSNKPAGQSVIFKIPHHGSENAHNDDVWAKMLVKKPYAVVTPYAPSKLPRSEDIQRITDLTPEAYITSYQDAPRSRTKYPPAVEKTLREASYDLRESDPPIGQVRLRNCGASKVQLSDAAGQL